jgi:hypothetical protein
MLVATEVPLRVVVGATVTVRLTVQGEPSRQLGWSITAAAAGGAFVPASGTVTLQASGLGIISTQLTAPAAAGDLEHTLTLGDGAHQASFTTRVRTLSAVGNDSSFVDSAGLQVAAGFLFGQRIAVGAELVAMRLGVFSDSSTSAGQLAIYTDAGGLPGTLVAASAAAPVGVGQTELDVVTPALLDPGTYWMMGSFATGTQVRRGPSANVMQAYVALGPGEPLPTTISGAMTLTDRALNYYAKVAP